MSSLCLLSVDDVYEQYWLAAEWLMVHKIKPRLSAAQRLPSGSHVVKACWEYKFQTDNQVKTANSSFFFLSPRCTPPPPPPPLHPAFLLWSPATLRRLVKPTEMAAAEPDSRSRFCLARAPGSVPLLPPLWAARCPSFPCKPATAVLQSSPAVYDKNIILLLLNNPINLSTGRKLTSCLFG